jgi:hypothetical protein
MGRRARTSDLLDALGFRAIAGKLPRPGARDTFRGFTIAVSQQWWGHRAEKRTWLYICGMAPKEVPPMPLIIGEAHAIIGTSGRRRDGGRLHKGDPGWRPEVTKREREATPPAFAKWLLDVARACQQPSRK